jgi:hypothetical protein
MSVRKLDTSETIMEALSIYGKQAGVLLPLAFGLYLLVAVISGLVAASSLVLVPLAIAISVVANTLYQGMVVELVSDVQDGRRDSSVGQLVKSAAPVIWPLLGAAILAAIGIGIGFLFLVIPGLILMTIWSVIAPVIVIERKGVLASFGRSRELVRGNGWRVFGVILTVFFIVIVVSLLIGAIAAGVADGTGAAIVSELIGSTLTAPITGLVAAVLYFRLRALGEPCTEGTVAPAPPAG